MLGGQTIDLLSLLKKDTIFVYFISAFVRKNDLFSTLTASQLGLKMSFFLTQVTMKLTQMLYILIFFLSRYASAQWLNSLVEGTNNYFDINIYFSHFFGLILLFL